MMFFRKKAATLLLIAVIGASVAVPLVAAAYTTPNLWGNPPGFWGPLVSCTGSFLNNNGGANGQPLPTCGSLCDLIGTFINIVYFAISIALFIVAPISFVIGGIMVMFSGANPEMLGRGKKILFGTVIGIVIVLCSYLIVATFLKILGVTVISGFGGSACTPD